MSNNPNRTNLRKYITTPDYKPLFAMAKDFGPTHGPLDRPTPTTVEIIGKLLQQSGRDEVHIFEVKKLSDDTFSKPVQLTLQNYTLPYEEIVAGAKNKELEHKVVDLGPTHKPIAPKIVSSEKVTPIEAKPVHKVRELSDIITVPDAITPVINIPKEEPVSEEFSPEVINTVEKQDINEETVDPNDQEEDSEPESAKSTEGDGPKKLSKAERKALRKLERQQMGGGNQN